MEKVPPQAGWLWVTEGFALFRQRPAELSTLFLSYMFLMFVLGIIPVLGQILPLLLVPLFSIAFMQACVHVEQGKRILPNLLLTGFRSPASGALLKLGGLYVAAAILAIGASSLVDGGVFWTVMTGQTELSAKTVGDSNIGLAMLFSAAVYTPAAMAFWYAAPLVAWQAMPVGKAVFFSFFAVQRAGKAFLVYGAAWIALGILMPAILSTFIALLFNQAVVTVVVLLPLSIVMTVVMYCSFYPTYTYIFGKPNPDALPDGGKTE
jgi:hypothetical protein